MEPRESIRVAERLRIASGHFAIAADRRIVAWDDAAACLLGVPSREALGRLCDRVVGGRGEFGRAACGPACPALKALAAGKLSGRSRVLGRTVDGERRRLVCDLTAMPAGGALGRLHLPQDAAPDLAYDLAGVAALTARASAEPLQQGLRHALEFLLHATSADAGEAFLAEPHGKGVVLACHEGRFERAFRELLRFDAGEGFPGLVLAHGQPVCTAQLEDDQRFLRDRVRQEGFGTYLCAPLARRGETLGCLALAFRRRDIDLDRVLDLLRWVSLSMGLVVETALSQLRQAAAARLQGIDDDPAPQLPRALDALLQEMVRVSCADAGELLLPWRGEALRSQVPGAGPSAWRRRLNAQLLARCPAFVSGQTIILQGRRKAWPAACSEAVDPGGAWCCVPLAGAGESLGMVRLLYRHLRPSPPSQNVALVEELAALAAEKLRELRDRNAAAVPAGASVHGSGQRNVAMTESHADALPRPSVRSAAGAASDPGEPRLEIRCFGALEIAVDGERIDAAAIRRKRVLTLLGILLTRCDRPQCKDALIELLWPGAAPDVRTKQFHVLVHELRKLLEPHAAGGHWRCVRNQGDRYRFDAGSSSWIDILEFRALIEAGRKAERAREDDAAIGAYEAAAGLYRGDYLRDEPFAEWCRPTRDELREACLDALERLAALWGRRGRWDRSIAWSRRALQLDALREEMHRSLMYALWASGRRDEAVRQYEACVHLLRERLDLTPLPETEQLFARIRAAPRPSTGH